MTFRRTLYNADTLMAERDRLRAAITDAVARLDKGVADDDAVSEPISGAGLAARDVAKLLRAALEGPGVPDECDHNFPNRGPDGDPGPNGVRLDWRDDGTYGLMPDQPNAAFTHVVPCRYCGKDIAVGDAVGEAWHEACEQQAKDEEER